MGTNLNLTSSVLVKNVGKNGQGESLDAGASLSIKRKINDVTYNARITEATVMNVGSFKGAWLQLAKPLGEIAGLRLPVLTCFASLSSSRTASLCTDCKRYSITSPEYCLRYFPCNAIYLGPGHSTR